MDATGPQCHLKLDRVGKSYGDLAVVHAVSLDVEAGEFVVLLGPSGCGKSTLLRLIAGLESISAGDLLVDGRSMARCHPRDRDIAMVFQNYALYPHMNVFANLEYPLKLRGLPRAEREMRVREVAELLELKPLLQRKPSQLSGGAAPARGDGACAGTEAVAFSHGRAPLQP